MKILDLNHMKDCLSDDSASLIEGGAIAYAASTSISGKGFSSSDFYAFARGASAITRSNVKLFTDTRYRGSYSSAATYVSAYAWS